MAGQWRTKQPTLPFETLKDQGSHQEPIIVEDFVREEEGEISEEDDNGNDGDEDDDDEDNREDKEDKEDEDEDEERDDVEGGDGPANAWSPYLQL